MKRLNGPDLLKRSSQNKCLLQKQPFPHFLMGCSAGQAVDRGDFVTGLIA